MTYFGFLLRFLIIPIAILLLVTLWDARRERKLPSSPGIWPLWAIVGLHVLIALIYTTPWDNYLVATGVWWYDPALVTGISLGWVPIEEYTFFVLQPILSGLWLAFLARRVRPRAEPLQKSTSPVWPSLVLCGLWVAAMVMLLSGWARGTYMALILVWALPPIMIQLLFGADILWRNRRLVFLTVAPMTLYLGAADSLAIGGGTWAIDPAQSFGFLLGGVLPVEEFTFFLVTNILISFGLVLLLAEDSYDRVAAIRQRWLRRPATVEIE